MTKIPKEKILQRLNAHSRDALHRAAELCMEQSGYEIGVNHLLHELLNQPANDVSRILSNLDQSSHDLKANVARSFEHNKRGAVEQPVFSPMLLHLLQDAFIISTGELDEAEIRTGALLAAIADDPGRYCHLFFMAEFDAMNAETMRRAFKELTRGSMEGSVEDGNNTQGPNASGTIQEAETALQKYGRCLTQQAREGKIDPVFRRDAEIALMSDILCRRRKNNPILVGEPGVGKTALAEGLALKVVDGDAPPSLLDVEIWELDLGALQAGASVKGEFERRLKGVLEDATNSDSKIVLFIDEAHTLIGGGGQQGGSDAANLLKPALARGALRAIAATTWSEYKKYFEKDPALARRFQLIKLEEPTPDEAVDILRGMRGAYETAHGVYISDDALSAASHLSARFITGRQLPDKALDVLDTASVRVAGAVNTKPRSLDFLEREIVLKERALESLSRDALSRGEPQDDKRTAELNADIASHRLEAERLQKCWEIEKKLVDRILDARKALLDAETGLVVPLPGAFEADEPTDTLNDEIDVALYGDHPQTPLAGSKDIEALQENLRAARAELRTEVAEREPLVSFEVDRETVASVIADWTGVPANMMSEGDAHRVLELGNTLRAVIHGQDGALDAIHNRLKAARTDLIRTNTPRGVFLLVGPSGVGKTETALQVAEQLYGGKQFLTTINMSEYQEKHTLSRLIGSPPGYVGYGEGGLLTEAIRRKPYSVVLLDEVEKAHPDIMNLFFQAFDKGELADGEGREIDCKNVVFFMTSNIGAEALEQNKETVSTASLAALERALRPHLQEHFRDALLARMHIICFKPLDDDVIGRIIDYKLDEQAKRFASTRHAELSWTPAVREAMSELCKHSENGARVVEHVIDRKLTPVIADEVLIRIAARDPLERIEIDVVDGQFEFTFLPKVALESLNATPELGADEGKVIGR